MSNIQYLKQLHQENIESFEAVTEFSPGQGFTSRLKDLFDGSMVYVKDQFAKLYEGKTDVVDLAKLIQIAEQFSTSDMKDVQVMQVPRLQVSWLTLAQALDSLQAITLEIDKRLIYPFQQYVGKGANKPSLLMSVSFNPEGYKFIDVKPMRDELNKMFGGEAKDFVLWENAFPRQRDVKDFSVVLNKLVLNDQKLSPQTVQKAVDSLNGTLRIIMEDIDDTGSEYHLNKRSASFISEMILQVAQHVELYVLTHNLVNDLNQCAIKTQETLGVKQ